MKMYEYMLSLRGVYGNKKKEILKILQKHKNIRILRHDSTYILGRIYDESEFKISDIEFVCSSCVTMFSIWKYNSILPYKISGKIHSFSYGENCCVLSEEVITRIIKFAKNVGSIL